MSDSPLASKMHPRCALSDYFMLNVQLTTSWLLEAICVMYMYLFQPTAPPTRPVSLYIITPFRLTDRFGLRSHYIFQYFTRSPPALFRRVTGQYSTLNLSNAPKSRGGLPCNPDRLIEMLRPAFMLHSEALPRCPPTNSSLFASGTRSSRCARFIEAQRASERKGTRVRGLGGVPIAGAPSDASYGHESERFDDGIRAREAGAAASIPEKARWTGRIAACEAVHCPGRAQSVRRRYSLDCAEKSFIRSKNALEHYSRARLGVQVPSSSAEVRVQQTAKLRLPAVFTALRKRLFKPA
ncbi:hypothetical protein FB451DRAFT_1417877 [Mycena latifolia]|nr:hypothetical protein FB451DRAFT_1417877 [Mycena latifolia]